MTESPTLNSTIFYSEKIAFHVIGWTVISTAAVGAAITDSALLGLALRITKNVRAAASARITNLEWPKTGKKRLDAKKERIGRQKHFKLSDGKIELILRLPGRARRGKKRNNQSLAKNNDT